MIKIWIVDSDVSFALHAKKFLQKKDRKIEVFFETEPFREALKKSKKEKDTKPDLILMEIHLSGEKGVDLYEEILNSYSFLSETVCFLSHVSFGNFEQEIEERNIPLPLFIAKSRFEKEIEETIQSLIEKKETSSSEKKLENFNFKLKRSREEFRKILESLNDFYYDSSKTKGMVDPVDEFLSRLVDQARLLNLPILVEKGERVKSIYANGKGGMRGKRELKDFLVLCDKESVRWK